MARSDATEKRSNALELENALLKRQLIEKGQELHEPIGRCIPEKTAGDGEVDALAQVNQALIL